jgi:hypothetical protein
MAKESVFSDLNNLDVASPLMIRPFSDEFGSTQPEVDLIPEAFDACGHADLIRD